MATTTVSRPATYYTTGNQTFSQNQLNNNMPGNVANDIYRATHQGQLNTPVGNTQASNPGSYVSQGTEKVTIRSNGGSSGGGGGSSSSTATSYSGGGGGGGFDYMSMIAQMLAQQRAAAQAAFDASKARLDEAWANTQSSLKSNLNSTLDSLKNNYDYSSGQANDDANKSLREAYINYMLNRKNMNQNMSAMGLSGGASESSLANMYNNYGSSRNNINTTLNESLAKLLNAYQNNVSSANQTYNSQYADAMNNYVNNLNALQSALANNLMSTYSGSSLSNLANYASTLSGLVDNMANVGFTPTENTLAVNKVSTTQNTGSDKSSNYAKYKAMVDAMSTSGASSTQIIQQLRNNGASLQEVFEALNA